MKGGDAYGKVPKELLSPINLLSLDGRGKVRVKSNLRGGRKEPWPGAW